MSFKAHSPNLRRRTERLITGLGGRESLFYKKDIIVPKVNSQLWNHGMTTANVPETLITNILNMPGFAGEFIVPDSHPGEEPDGRGRAAEMCAGHCSLLNPRSVSRTRDIPMLPSTISVRLAQIRARARWIAKGVPLMHPGGSDGYIWPEDLLCECRYRNRTALAHPVFTSSHLDTSTDLKNGIFRSGEFTAQQTKSVNFSILNHRSQYAGVIASIKNYMGVEDMSCCQPVPNLKRNFNTRHIGTSSLFRFLTRTGKMLADVSLC